MMAVTVEEALEIIYTNIQAKPLKLLPIEESLGYVLGENIIASHNLPPYDNSAMDGYALKIEDGGKCLHVAHTIFAGDDFHGELYHGEAIKIMTGAKIPLGTQCIVPIEETQACEEGVLMPQNLVLSKHIRLCGEDIKKETKLLSKGERINAYSITLLASQGITHVKVFKKPRVSLFASGNELKMHFEKVESYQLYNTNTPMLLSRALEFGCEVTFIGTANDTLGEIEEQIKSALDSDLIITSGGVSVGDADFTKEAFKNLGAQNYFEKIEIKPGKPTTFGRIKDTFVLNLPGNPLAAALNFELFGQSIILALSGDNARFLSSINAKMQEDFEVKKGRRSLIPGFFDGEYFKVCEKFSPGMISPLAYANAYIMIDENCACLAQNAVVKIIPTKFRFTSSHIKNLTTL